MAMIIESGAFPNGGKIPDEYTCTGVGVSPPLAWRNAPANTASFALITEDPDAPRGTFDHWIIFNIPSGSAGLAEDLPRRERLGNGGLQGTNSAGKIGYMGPCPPSGEHRYFFRLFALDSMLELPSGSTKRELQEAMEGHVLAEADLIGLYSK